MLRRRPYLQIGLLGACAAMEACHGAGNTDASVDAARAPTPDPWTDALAITHFEDLNADPHIVEVNLEARPAEWTIAPGRTVHAMTYNGSVPGPLLEAHVGDTVIVHFTNHLAEPTTIHWHGVRVTNDMDGAPVSQSPVHPGASLDYHFVVPDAGTFWYHPHVDDAVQMEYELYGPIVVRGDAEPVVDHGGVVMLDDLTLGADGQIAPLDVDPLEQHSGREGGSTATDAGNGRDTAIVTDTGGSTDAAVDVTADLAVTDAVSNDAGTIPVINACTSGVYMDMSGGTASDRMIMMNAAHQFDMPCMTINSGQAVMFMWNLATYPIAAGVAPSHATDPSGTTPTPIQAHATGSVYTVTFPTAGFYPFYVPNQDTNGLLGVIQIQ